MTVNDNVLKLADLQIPLKIRKGRARRISLRFLEEFLLVETTNGQLSPQDHLFIQQNEKWIKGNYFRHLSGWQEKNRFLQFADTYTEIFGIPTPVTIIPGASYHYHYRNTELQITAPSAALSKKKEMIGAVTRKISETYLTKRVNYWSEITQLKFNQLRIKNHQSKWGSCSSLQNINLNWHLILLTKEQIDYVIIHELMHLKEMNHSPRFWAWVEKYCPDYRRIRKSIRDRQWIIGIYS